MTSRREFLAGAAAAFAAAPFASAPALAQRHLLLGLQLYTVRADLAKDYEGTLKLVKAAGVRKVQANLTMSGRTSQNVQSSLSSATPMCRAIALKWIGALVEPPMAELTTMTFSNASRVMILDGRRSSHTMSTMRFPVS